MFPPELDDAKTKLTQNWTSFPGGFNYLGKGTVFLAGGRVEPPSHSIEGHEEKSRFHGEHGFPSEDFQPIDPPGSVPWTRSGSSASSRGRRKPWRSGCRA